MKVVGVLFVVKSWLRMGCCGGCGNRVLLCRWSWLGCDCRFDCCGCDHGRVVGDAVLFVITLIVGDRRSCGGCGDCGAGVGLLWWWWWWWWCSGVVVVV